MAEGHAFDRSEIRSLLTELGDRLEAKGVQATLYVVGGAAVAINLDTRRVTRDIDAVFHPRSDVRSEADLMAEERGLPGSWLNDAAAAWVPGDDADAAVFGTGGLTVSVASPRHLLAMKMVAFRATDRTDLLAIFDALGITTATEAADIATAVYGGHHALPDREELMLVAEAVLADKARTRKAGGQAP